MYDSYRLTGTLFWELGLPKWDHQARSPEPLKRPAKLEEFSHLNPFPSGVTNSSYKPGHAGSQHMKDA